ncbi:hypothetical protein Agabi119p4_8242 [Agaricus bisporus var. burnettii]|uniref:Uncharacterized protein n=1 Tax=Agaricus bisporus var. burnettii TaxID=192524 RepID=A0A8H7C6S5_AGABI|nr:hypothetical protein Agabi119p4_8242 [Agaricus bisporus var. burnettii]
MINNASAAICSAFYSVRHAAYSCTNPPLVISPELYHLCLLMNIYVGVHEGAVATSFGFEFRALALTGTRGTVSIITIKTPQKSATKFEATGLPGISNLGRTDRLTKSIAPSI